jgi:hypothetical protein
MMGGGRNAKATPSWIVKNFGCRPAMIDSTCNSSPGRSDQFSNVTMHMPLFGDCIASSRE